jgi:hypothetical protein
MAMSPLLRLFELLKARGLLASLTSGRNHATGKTSRASPAESRKTCGSKAGFCVDFVLDLILAEVLVACIKPALPHQSTIVTRLETILSVGTRACA